MPSGTPGSLAPQVGEDPVGLLRQRAVGQQVEGPDVAAPGVVNVEHAFIGGEGEAVGHDKVIDEQAQGAQIGRDAVHAGKGQVPLLGRQVAGPGSVK